MFLGLDIGSSSSKAALIDKNKSILALEVINLGTGSNGIKEALRIVFDKTGVNKEDILYSVVTGYGRTTYKGADAQITEISCHAKGVTHLIPETRTVIDIGGQDAKVIRIDDNGTVADFVMNDKCAAGTGRFLEVMARVLGCDIGTLSDVADGSEKSVTISNTCAVFAESEVISQLSIGSKREDVALGALVSIAKRVSGLAARVGVVPKVAMTGGVALNNNMVRALEKEIGYSIILPESPQTIGALGAAVFALEKYTKRKK